MVSCGCLVAGLAFGFVLDLCLVGRGIGVGSGCVLGFWLRVSLVVVWRLSFLGPVSPGLFVLWSGVFGVLGLDSRCCLALVLSGALDGAWGIVAGLALGVAVVASSGVAPLVGILDVSGSGLGCCGWLGAGRAWGWGLGASLGGCRRLPVYFIIFS